MSNDSRRTRRVGPAAIRAALDRGAPLQLLVCRRDEDDAERAAIVEEARRRGIVVRFASERELLRLTEGAEAAPILALEGPTTRPSLEELMTRAGLVLVLVGLRYPGNVGFIVRAAEVAGATGVVLAEQWTRAERASAMRFAMQADRFFPVLEAEAEAVVAAARGAGRRLVALETEGATPPWTASLEGPLTVFLGGEALGVPAGILARMDACLRIPMRGFIPSYNVQAAAGIVLGEWLRQTHEPEA